MWASSTLCAQLLAQSLLKARSEPSRQCFGSPYRLQTCPHGVRQPQICATPSRQPSSQHKQRCSSHSCLGCIFCMSCHALKQAPCLTCTTDRRCAEPTSSPSTTATVSCHQGPLAVPPAVTLTARECKPGLHKSMPYLCRVAARPTIVGSISTHTAACKWIIRHI